MARSNRPVILAAVGAVVVVGGIVAFTVASLSGAGGTPMTPESTPTGAPSFDPSEYLSLIHI